MNNENNSEEKGDGKHHFTQFQAILKIVVIKAAWYLKKR